VTFPTPFVPIDDVLLLASFLAFFFSEHYSSRDRTTDFSLISHDHDTDVQCHTFSSLPNTLFVLSSPMEMYFSVSAIAGNDAMSVSIQQNSSYSCTVGSQRLQYSAFLFLHHWPTQLIMDHKCNVGDCVFFTEVETMELLTDLFISKSTTN